VQIGDTGPLGSWSRLVPTTVHDAKPEQAIQVGLEARVNKRIAHLSKGLNRGLIGRLGGVGIKQLTLQVNVLSKQFSPTFLSVSLKFSVESHNVPLRDQHLVVLSKRALVGNGWSCLTLGSKKRAARRRAYGLAQKMLCVYIAGPSRILFVQCLGETR